MRDKIAEIITYADAYDDTLSTANLIVRSLPDILREHIPPLEWVGSGAFTQVGVYQILSGSDNAFGFRVSSISPTTNYWSWESKKEAQDAAKDHYIEILMKAMGLE